eukprot:TRINITY_DN22283_c0_g1_i2.p1 TRINITY_DN22283_c0_g1~~TRINITY_DN22283_c0_g1_i2.p1  ORF type:complete len:433 (-),score=47.01 TRINITY_DN22283_c0_g1_i2:151-1275(-)
MIAPCLCAGSVKWVHRHCLDRWRSTGMGPRRFTNCPNCAFAYLMVLQRAPTETEQDLRQRRRRLLGTAVSHFVLSSIGVQFIIAVVALLLRAFDTNEELVKLLPCRHEHRHSQDDDGSFMSALKYHKSTYYIFSVLLLLGVFGFCVSCVAVSRACTVVSRACTSQPAPSARTTAAAGVATAGVASAAPGGVEDIEQPEIYYGYSTSPVDQYLHWRACEDCCLVCSDCANTCVRCNDLSSDSLPCGDACCGDDDSCGACVLAAAFILVIAFVCIGIFFALGAFITWLHRVCQRYFQLRELRELAGEYVVQDLSQMKIPAAQSSEATSSDQTLSPPMQHELSPSPSAPPALWLPSSEPVVQQSLTRDMQAIYGISV